MQLSKDNTFVKHNLFFISFLSIAIMFSILLGSIILSQTYFFSFFLFQIFMLVVILVSSQISFKINDNSAILAIVIAFSAFQNIYIGYFVNDIEAVNVKIITVTTFVFPTIYLCILMLRHRNIFIDKYVMNITMIGGILFLYSLITAIIFEPPMVPAFASFRNIISPILFTLIGVFAAAKCNREQYIKYILCIGIIVIIVGVIERIIFPDFWNVFNVKELYEKKGIMKDLSFVSVPHTWYTSELIGGNRLRRMVSSFGDPVNLGTFMFLAFVMSYLVRNKLIMILSLTSIALVVSKGGLLSSIIFINIYSYYKHRKSYPIVMILSLVIYVILYVVIKENSTGSMLAHIRGFTNSILQLQDYIFGRGIGSTGVLQNLFRENRLHSTVKESGIGVLISQLGIIGILSYFSLYKIIYNKLRMLENDEIKIASFSLLYAILANMVFNEVAMSPNSCAGYFIFIGLIIGRKPQQQIDAAW